MECKVEIEEDSSDIVLEGTPVKKEIKEENMDIEDPLSIHNHQGKVRGFWHFPSTDLHEICLGLKAIGPKA